MIRTGSIRLGQSVSDGTQLDWSWNESAETASAAVSAQEVDPLTEYQVYKQFGYQGKAAESLAAYLDGIPDGEAKPENLIRELIDINLEVGGCRCFGRQSAKIRQTDSFRTFGKIYRTGITARFKPFAYPRLGGRRFGIGHSGD